MEANLLLPMDASLCAVVAVIGAGAFYLLNLVIYRLFLSPLAKFPGPKLAAVTSWYELYYDLVHKGKYLFEIEKMHDKYGPIVRINPFELSIRDSEYYDELYVTGSVRPTDRHEAFVEGIVDFKGSHIATTEHDLHRKRRKPLDPYFSRLGVSRLEPMLGELTEKLIVNRFESFKGTGKVVRLDHAFTAYSGDVINRLCMDDPPDVLVNDPEFSPWWYNLFHNGIATLPLFMGLPWLIHVVRLIPVSILAKLDPGTQTFNKFKMMCDNHLRVAKREKASLGSKDTSMMGGRPTIFRHLLNSDLPPSELTDDRLSKEAQVLIGTGTVTTAGSLCFICYHIMVNPAIKKRLQEDLKPIMANYPPKKPTWAELETAPYLQAVIKEGLRLSFGTMHRCTRVSPKQPLQFRQWTIPAGVPVGMSAYYSHRDPSVFPRPDEFLPERWLADVTPEMSRNYVPFSKGSRRCLGTNLAYAEINHIIATLFRPGGPDFSLYETSEKDVKPAHDLIVPLPSLESKGFRVIFH
ncbi:trichodiene oxygenase [Aspergillus udagawae]|uniref:Trichodiene oxygenase n=1 Tax=Aspergillus udagawae TaxID=91492 RepID=A0A8H3NHZ0_9EURO|nr:trichodiene oxygenase [Aspergillus udagawae]